MKLTIKKSEVLKAIKSATFQEVISLSSYGQTRYVEMRVKREDLASRLLEDIRFSFMSSAQSEEDKGRTNSVFTPDGCHRYRWNGWSSWFGGDIEAGYCGKVKFSRYLPTGLEVSILLGDIIGEVIEARNLGYKYPHDELSRVCEALGLLGAHVERVDFDHAEQLRKRHEIKE